MNIDATAGVLRRHAGTFAGRSFAPFSGRTEGCVIMLEDGSLVAGVRVESASFSLIIPATINALSTMAALGRQDAVAIALNTDPTAADRAILESTFAGRFTERSAGVFLRAGVESLPNVAGWLDPVMPVPADGIAAAREIAVRAVVPQSDFPVGCVLVTDRAQAIPGVNVEHDDWARVICAERNALGTLITYDLGTAHSLFITCLHDPDGSPCGACRQLIAELAPEAEICMDRGANPPLNTTPSDLLPGAFAGGAIPTRSGRSSS